MDIYLYTLFGAIVLALLTLLKLSQLLRTLIKEQIDKQMKDMIPIKAIREKIAIRIKLR